MTQYGFYFDQSRCYGCQACSVACKDWNNIAPGPEKWMAVYEWEKGTFPNMRLHELAFPCGHCEKPACALACPNGAIFKEDKYGAVLVDEQKCKGARKCLDACPYGTPRFADDEPGTKMTKCTMCIDRLEAGNIPICVASCPMRALDFGPMDELIKKYGDCRQLEDMPDPATTVPSWVATPHAPKQMLVPFPAEEAVELAKQRGHLGTIFEDEADLAPEDEKIIVRNKLVMKNFTAADVMAATTNDHG